MWLAHEEATRYRAYMLRMWRVNAGAWRFSLENVETKEKRGFEGLEELVAWLRGQLEKKRNVPA